MVYTTLTDRIGNNLFQIATGASLAYRNKTFYRACVSEFVLPDNTTLRDLVDKYKKTLFRNVEFVYGIPDDSAEYVQPGFHYTPIPYVDKIRLNGYFQSEKFFEEKYVRNLFSIDSITYSYIQEKYGKLLKNEIISIHVRRGDYLKYPKHQSVCSLKYYNNAINYFGQNKHFLVLSDDINWCKRKFKGENFFFSEQEDPVVDLYLQSLSTHNIISNSSFSWWGAWLNDNPNKVVIAPNPWYGKELSHLNLKDLLPDSWIKLDNPKSFFLRKRIFLYDTKKFYLRIKRRFHI